MSIAMRKWAHGFRSASLGIRSGAKHRVSKDAIEGDDTPLGVVMGRRQATQIPLTASLRKRCGAPLVPSG
jgi:hypothetical protein